MEIDYDKDFKKVLTELQTNFGWSNIEVLPDSYKDLLNDTIKAVKNCSIHNVSDMLCGSFDPDNSTSSATKCKCGREKWEHPKPRN